MQVKLGFVSMGLLIILTVLTLAIAGGILFWQRKALVQPLSAEPAESVFSALHQPCDSKEGCPFGLECVGYYGIAGSKGPLFKTCEILCPNGDSDCPEGLACSTIVDGPGEVCVVIQN